MTDLILAGLLASRLCHDLVSPVGALGNGVELLSEETDADMRAQCLALLSASARQTANRLRFFRLAFGSGGKYGDALDAREVGQALEGLFADSRVVVQWLVSSASVEKSIARIALNFALMAGDALLRGGELEVRVDPAASVVVSVTAKGPRVHVIEDVSAALAGLTPLSALTPRAAPALLVRLLAAENDLVLEPLALAEGMARLIARRQ